MKFAVLGGDMRIARLGLLLEEDGHKVSYLALQNAECLQSSKMEVSVEKAVEGADCVILPLPADQKGILNAPLSPDVLMMTEILENIPPNTLVCGGRIGPELLSLAEKKNIRLVDYFNREELVVKNAVATAEGALEIMMRETPIMVWQSKVLLIGFGRIGKLLAHRLRGVGAEVTVSARSYGDLAWIEAYGYKAVDTYALEGKLKGFDVIINTVPAMVLDEKRLLEIEKETLCIDLASKPGGIDFSAASSTGVSTIWALSLPGEVAPGRYPQQCLAWDF